MIRDLSEANLSGAPAYKRLLALLDERRFEEAQVRARVLLESGEVGPLLRAKIHNLLCWTFIEGLKRSTPEAVLHGEEAVRLADLLRERTLQVEALFNLASAQHQIGAYDMSHRTYVEIMTHLDREPSLVPYGQILARQGRAQFCSVMGRPDEALYQLGEALDLCEGHDCRSLKADVQRRRALACVDYGHPEKAAVILSDITDDSFGSGPRSLWWKTHLAFTRARVEIALSRSAQARPLVMTTMALATELGDLPVLAEATCLLALVNHAEGRRDVLVHARKALAQAIHAGRRDVVDEVRRRLYGLSPEF